MESGSHSLVVTLAIYSLIALVTGIYKTKRRKDSFGISWAFFPIGAFVWGDVVIFGLFWLLVSIYTLYLQDWLLILLTYSSFWLIRSLGETLYWFIQQFTPSRNPPEKMIGFKLFSDGDSIWFVYQTVVQCISVISLIATIYLATLWIRTI